MARAIRDAESDAAPAQLGIRHFAQAVMRKIVRARATPVYDAPLPQFLERARQAVFVPVGRLGEYVK